MIIKSQILSVLVITFLSFNAYGQDDDCEAGAKSHYDDRMCQGKRLERLDDELNQVYKRALAALPEKDEWDNRKGREQLRKSQRAWLTYIREECAFEGGMEGGSNSWVSTFAGLCEEREFKSRIELLKSIADDGFEEKY